MYAYVTVKKKNGSIVLHKSPLTFYDSRKCLYSFNVQKLIFYNWSRILTTDGDPYIRPGSSIDFLNLRKLDKYLRSEVDTTSKPVKKKPQYDLFLQWPRFFPSKTHPQ